MSYALPERFTRSDKCIIHVPLVRTALPLRQLQQPPQLNKSGPPLTR